MPKVMYSTSIGAPQQSPSVKNDTRRKPLKNNKKKSGVKNGR